MHKRVPLYMSVRMVMPRSWSWLAVQATKVQAKPKAKQKAKTLRFQLVKHRKSYAIPIKRVVTR